MAVLGVGLSGLLAAVAGAYLFASLLRGLPHPMLGALTGAVFAVADVVSGRTTFALGAVAALAALRCLQHRRATIVLAVLTALLSPVAAAFLGFAAAILVLHRRAGGWTLGLSASAPVVVLAVLFPSGGVQPFRSSAGWGIAAGLLLLALSSSPLLRTGGLLYAIVVLVLTTTADPFGSNILRLALLVAAPLVLASARRPFVIALVAAVALTQWQVRPTQADMRSHPGPPVRALERALVRLDSRRVEVAPLRDHQEADTVSDVVPLARGWSRQIDYRDNSLFYKGTLTSLRYRAWLLAHSVDAVALPLDSTIDFGGTREAKLLRSASLDGLEPVWHDQHWQVWRVVDPQPIAGLPAVVLASGRTTLTLRSEEVATVPVDVRWSHWLSLTGPGCLLRDGDRTRVRFTAPGTVVLGSGLAPTGHC